MPQDRLHCADCSEALLAFQDRQEGMMQQDLTLAPTDFRLKAYGQSSVVLFCRDNPVAVVENGYIGDITE